MDAPSNLDRRNVLRGKCKAIDCDCELFESAKTSDFCRYCNDPPTKHVNLGLGDVKARDKGDKASLELPEENTNEKATDINNTTLIKQSDSTVDLDKHEESSTFSSSPQPGPNSRLDKDDELDIDKPFADISSASVVAADNLPDNGDGQCKMTDSPVSSSSTKEMTSVLKYSKEVIEREKKPWEKAQFGWIEKPQRASGIFYNKILPSFYESYWPANPNEKSFKAAFYLEKKREWEDSNELEAHKRSFRYLCSDNNAAAGNFLEATYVPKKNDLYSIQTVHKSIVGVKENVNELLEKIKLFDDSLFKKAKDGKEKLKTGRNHHHKFNEDMFKEISNFFKQIDEILKKLQQAESLCKETFKCSHAVASRSEKKKVIDNKYKAKKRKEEALRGKAKSLFERLGDVLAANEYFEPEFGALQLEVLEEDTLECVMTELKNTEALELLFNAGIFRCQANDTVLHFLDTDNAKEFNISTVVPNTVKEKAKQIDLNKFKYSK